jgi:hypothetical protein
VNIFESFVAINTRRYSPSPAQTSDSSERQIRNIPK